MATGDKLGRLVCPCCSGAWEATEMKGGGTSFKCPNGFVGWAKGPRANAGILAKLKPAAPAAKVPAAPAAAPAAKPAPTPAKRGGFMAFLAGDDE